MNILITTDHFWPDIMGGSGRVAYELSSLFASQGHRVTIFTRQWQPSHAVRETLEGMEVRRYQPDLSSPFRFSASVKTAVKSLYADVFGNTPPDAVHIHQPASAAGLLPVLREKRIPAFYFFYAPWKREYIAGRTAHAGATVSDWVRGLLLQRMERQVISAAQTVVTLSRFSENQFRSLHRHEGQHILQSTPGVNSAHFTPMDRETCRAALNLPLDSRILFTLRNLQPNMGLESLLEAFKRLYDEDTRYHLVVGGRGPSETDLVERVSRYGLGAAVRFTGYIDEKDLPSYYNAADLFVLPNAERDGFGLQIAEALACGIPACGTPSGAVPEILHRLEPRLLCASTTPESLYATLHNFFLMPLSRADWLAKCRDFAIRRFAWDKLAADILPPIERTPLS